MSQLSRDNWPVEVLCDQMQEWKTDVKSNSVITSISPSVMFVLQ